MAVQEQLIIQARAETSQAVAGMQALSKATDDVTASQKSQAAASQQVAQSTAQSTSSMQQATQAQEQFAAKAAQVEQSSARSAKASADVGIQTELSAIKVRQSAMMILGASRRINASFEQEGARAVGTFSAGVGQAVYALEGFVAGAGPVGVALIGIGSALSLGASLWKAYKKATDEAAEASAAAAAKIHDDVAGLVANTAEAQRAALIEKRRQIQNQALQEYAEFLADERGLTEQSFSFSQVSPSRMMPKEHIEWASERIKNFTNVIDGAANRTEWIDQKVAELSESSDGLGRALLHMTSASGNAEEAVAILDQQIRALEPVQRSVTENTNEHTRALHTNTSATHRAAASFMDFAKWIGETMGISADMRERLSEDFDRVLQARKQREQEMIREWLKHDEQMDAESRNRKEMRQEQADKRELMRKKKLLADEAEAEKKLNDQRQRDADFQETTNRAIAQSFAAIGQAIGSSLAGDGESAIDTTKHIVANVAQMYGQLYLLQGAKDLWNDPPLGAVEIASGTGLMALAASLGGSSASSGGSSANAGASGTGSSAGPVEQAPAPSGTFGYFSNTGDRATPGIVVISKDAGSTRFALRQLQMTEARGGSGF